MKGLVLMIGLVLSRQSSREHMSADGPEGRGTFAQLTPAQVG